PRAGEQRRGAQEDRRAVLPGQPRPVVPRVARGADRALDLGGAALVDVGEHVAALVRLDRFERLAGAHLLATDDQRDVEPLRLHVTESPLELLALRRSGRIAANRLV